MSDNLTQTQAEEEVCPMFPDMCDRSEPVEPEVDGDHKYKECPDCGYAWGYERVAEGVTIDGSCSIGVPESVRRAASAPMETAIASERRAQPVELGLTIGRRPQE